MVSSLLLALDEALALLLLLLVLPVEEEAAAAAEGVEASTLDTLVLVVAVLAEEELEVLLVLVFVLVGVLAFVVGSEVEGSAFLVVVLIVGVEDCVVVGATGGGEATLAELAVGGGGVDEIDETDGDLVLVFNDTELGAVFILPMLFDAATLLALVVGEVA